MSYFAHNGDYPFGIDLSRYNATADLKRWPDFDLVAKHVPKVEFVAIRAGVSWGYRDPMFKRFYKESTRIGACVSPYHVLYPGEPALKQMNHFLNILEGIDLDTVRLVLDVELVHDQSRSMITNTLLGCLDLLKYETGRYPIVYSRALWINEHVHIKDLPELDWWLAHYYARRPWPAYTPEYPCPPLMPKGVDNWLIHQTAERAPAIGGVGNFMDYNRWNGTSESL
ncbi:MAG TPA: GH25 family lysozyme, partial [Anaerolineaceae bacterium]|nr:GH25 family lysozyme [Anaerolineaceae bacterium]